MSEPEPTQGASEADDEGLPSAAAGDADLPAPRPDRTPEDVVRTVLSALRERDEGTGVATAFGFASPAFRSRVGGSVDAFRDHLTDPITRAVVGHDRAKRGRLDAGDGRATEKVVVFPDAGDGDGDGDGDDGDPRTYSFSLRKVEGGKYDGCWMLDGIELVYVGESPDHRYMPVVEFDGVEIKCSEGEVLRDVLLRASGVSPHNSAANYANCNGNGLCGTCAVEVHGEVTEPTAQENRRMKLPPHRGTDDPNYRLSCQCEVLGDLVVHKGGGGWGQHLEEYVSGTDEEPDAEPIRVSAEEYRGEGADDGGEAAVDPGGDPDDLELSDEARELLERATEDLDDDPE
jgi:ferredoxin